MGMFDEIEVRDETPEIPFTFDPHGQTKSWERVLARLVVEDGRLLLTRHEERVVGEQPLLPGSDIMVDATEVVRSWLVPLPVSGDLVVSVDSDDGAAPEHPRIVAPVEAGVVGPWRAVSDEDQELSGLACEFCSPARGRHEDEPDSAAVLAAVSLLGHAATEGAVPEHLAEYLRQAFGWVAADEHADVK